MKLQKTTKIIFILPLAFMLSIHLFASQLRINQMNQIQQETTDSVYSIVDKMPEFIGGQKALITFLNQTVSYPAEALKKEEQGKVVIQFTITKSGKVENAKVLRSVSSSLDAEALRVIGLLPDWTPGEQNGEKVSVYQIMPVAFQIPTEESLWQVNEKTLIVIDSVKMPEKFNTKVLNPNKLSSVTVLKPFPKEEKSKLMAKYGKQAADGVVLISTNKEEIYYALADSLDTVNTENCKDHAKIPEFPGGKPELIRFLSDSIQYPFVPKELKTQGKVIVRFLIDKSGKVTNAQVMKPLDYYLDKEALRVINTLPDWTPGIRCGKNINIYVTMPVEFKLELPKSQKEWEPNAKTIILLDGVRLPASFDLAWLNYANLASYKVLQPSTKEITKNLVKEYGKDAVNGVILIECIK